MGSCEDSETFWPKRYLSEHKAVDLRKYFENNWFVGPRNIIIVLHYMMRCHKFYNFLLLAYLVLLLGLGPSLHHYEALGFHQHSESETADKTPVATCSCHAHAPSKRNDTDTLVGISEKVELDECALCKFFDEFQVVVNNHLILINETPAFPASEESPTSFFAYSVLCVARGPPVV